MSGAEAAGLAALIAMAAFLYSSVGHAGASGYLAAMALFGLAPAMMKPTALTLNILVATLATIQFCRAGWFSWALFWRFAPTSVPAAFLGGRMALDASLYKGLLGLVLLYGAWHLLGVGRKAGPGLELKPVPILPPLVLGGGIGFLAGLTGVGGGIFLTPLLLLLRWADPHRAAAVSAAFILVNSSAGLLGHSSSLQQLPPEIWIWGGAAILGGYAGSTLGSRRFSGTRLRQLLALVLAIAGIKMLAG